MSRAFIIGNGPSRMGLNLEQLRGKGDIWGCNALYRDFAPDHLVVVDLKMQEEVFKSGYYKEHICRFKAHENPGRRPVFVHPNIIYFKHRLTSPHNSGVAAVFLAMKYGHRDIWLFGFDLQNPSNPLDNNVYAGTKQYERHNKKPPHFIQKVTERLAYFAEANQGKVRFTRVWAPGACTRPNLPGFREEFMRHITMDEAKKELNIE